KTCYNSVHKGETQEFGNCKILKVARPFFCKVRRELLSEKIGNELPATRKRKDHCQCSADS
ncbi:unnamed protein product, partial [Hymenolepis diminuta]